VTDPVRRRRRVRSSGEPGAGHTRAEPATQGPAGGTTASTDGVADEPAVWVREPSEPVSDLEPSPAERGLRGLVGGGSSQVSPTIALRARDAARPRPEDLARAEAELTVVRRHWAPRD